MVEACAIKHLPAPEDYMDFIFCAEGSMASPEELISKCSKASVKSDIEACYGKGTGAEGKALIAAAGAATAPLKHEYTPWVVLDGTHSKAAEQNLEKAICDAYKGAEKPAACAKFGAEELIGIAYAENRCFRDSSPVVENLTKTIFA